MRFLFVDRITELKPGVSIKGLKHVTRDDYYLRQDVSGDWCFVPSLVGETLGQLAAWNVMATHDFAVRPVAGIAASVLFYRPVYVGETLLLEAHIDGLDQTAVQYHGDVHVGHELVFRLEGALGPLLPMPDFIDETVVRRQFNEINRPLEEELIDSTERVRSDGLSSMGTAYTPPMQFDRIIESEPGVSLRAEKCITRASSYFPDHFPNKPVLPMTVLLECFVDLACKLLHQAGYHGHYTCKKMRRVKMSDFIMPGDVVVGSVSFKMRTEEDVTLLCRCDLNGRRVGVLELTMTPRIMT